jgi:hypothetical protein
VLDALPPDARAFAAAAALAALPGVLVVRAPWRAVPLISLAFWVTSWWWIFGASRTRFLQASLAVFVALSLFRVIRPGPLPRRGWAQLMIVGTAFVLAGAPARRTVPSGVDAPIDALSAQLLAWHDGWPVSFEPLSPRRPFEASGLAAVGADVILLSGAPAHRALAAMTAVADVALLLALWSLACLRLPPGRAAAGAAAALLPVTAMAESSGVLAAAFAVEAAALWHDRRGHASAFTAGACVAAGLATDAATALGGLMVALLLARFRAAPSVAVSRAPHAPRRLRTVLWTVAIVGLALLWRPPRLDLSRAPLPASDVVTPDDMAAMTWIRHHTRPLDVVCAPEVPPARWIPAVAARATTVSLRPGWPRPDGPCAVRISLSGRLPPGAGDAEAAAFRAGSAAVWTNSENR